MDKITINLIPISTKLRNLFHLRLLEFKSYILLVSVFFYLFCNVFSQNVYIVLNYFVSFLTFFIISKTLLAFSNFFNLVLKVFPKITILQALVLFGIIAFANDLFAFKERNHTVQDLNTFTNNPNLEGLTL